MERNGTVSVVIPAYNEGEMVAVTGKTLREFFCTAGIPYELVFVDDGSKDGTWDSIKTLTRFHQANDAGTVKGISFSRNFGKESAIMAGLEEATGDCVVVIDCDLQHPYEKILDMYRLWSEGYDVVDGVKSDRGKESILHKAMSSLFYRIVSVAIGSDMKGSSDFKLLDRAVVAEILKCKEHDPFFRGLSAWAGFKRTKVEYEVRERTKGQSKWSFRSLARYAVRNITGFSSAPAMIPFVIGIAHLMAAFVMLVAIIVYLSQGKDISPVLILSMVIVLETGLILASAGIIAYYVARTYKEAQGRKRYIVAEKTGNNADET